MSTALMCSFGGKMVVFMHPGLEFLAEKSLNHKVHEVHKEAQRKES
jgi:hypothetical protein